MQQKGAKKGNRYGTPMQLLPTMPHDITLVALLTLVTEVCSFRLCFLILCLLSTYCKVCMII